MSAQHVAAPRVPRHISLFAPLLERLMAVGIPLGPNVLLTVRGRTSGVPRTTGVAVVEFSGRRWIWCPWGEVHWVRNLRAAGRAEIDKRGRKEEVRAKELDQAERGAFFHDVLVPFARSIPGGFTFVRVIDGVDLRDPDRAAEGTRVFELHPAR